ncbi:response regulator [Pseudogracilibacillus sp. SO30301A]|uniref:response regulator n=1 Tax=Pseudogracilibacillus sp. SO30301A TaxID=3098291 RepID=UPI00300E0F2E
MKIILVDDEALALEFLELQINKIMDAEITKFTYLDPKEHKKVIQDSDLVFLDIEMPGRNGLELADKIVETNPHLQIVFITAFNEYAVEAFELNALDYILKPVQVARLEKTFERLDIRKILKTDPTSGTLQISVCGNLTFKQDGNSKFIKWRTAKAREIFLFLLHHSGMMVRKSELVEIHWPDLELERAFSQLYTTVYNIRKTLNAFGNHLTVKSVQDGYILILKNVIVDIVKWEEEITNAPPIHIETIDIYEKIMELYTDAYLNNYDYLWAESIRYRLEQLWVKVANRIGNCYEKNNCLEEAVKWYVKICNLKPEDERANFSLMKMYAKLEYGLLVNYQYTQLEKALKELDIDINPDIKKWYIDWKK